MDYIYSKPGHLIRRAFQILNALFAEACGDFGLTSVQYAALYTIREYPGIDATRLSELIFFDRATIGDVLARLENKGFIVRRTTPADKRIRLLHISPEGRSIVRRAAPAVDQVQDRLLAALTVTQQKALVKLLQKLVTGHRGLAEAPPKNGGAKRHRVAGSARKSRE